MRGIILATIAASTALTACGRRDDPPPAPAEAPSTAAPTSAPVPFREADPEGWSRTVPAAMQEIPDADRGSFQRLLACRIQASSRAGRPLAVTADLVRQTYAAMRADPAAAANCQNM